MTTIRDRKSRGNRQASALTAMPIVTFIGFLKSPLRLRAASQSQSQLSLSSLTPTSVPPSHSATTMSYENYKVGLITALTDLKKPLRSLTIDVGSSSPITVVTNAPNVRVSSRIVVATLGAIVPSGADPEEDGVITISRTSVGGVMSEGMVCDSKILNWVGGGEGVAVQVPDTFDLGVEPPSSKPRMDGKPADSGVEGGMEGLSVEAEPLFEKKMTKEEKKAAAKAKREGAKLRSCEERSDELGMWYLCS
ncbi:hypothetical protein TL16_g01489 [Triparma laevis f. inornata]|uniref:tRNA-binding domain-containing protein n=1 Tax=Triparma laevis f. inornata TaxID=1714386 RepID=A0A9W6ZNS9_9STRA|nr:hypothetical protein TL16_g01489 [Triparma laevis f. inornata]